MIRGMILALGGVILASASPAQDAEAGKQVAGMCRTCHGLDGIARIPVAPNIAGEKATYLEMQLHAFKSGARVNEMMTIVVGSLSDQQIADVAAWYASHPVVAELAANPDDAPQVCVACHGADGISVIDEAPNLAGSQSQYLQGQLMDLRSGKRVSEVMNAIAVDLTDAEIKAAADWYSSIKLSVVSP